MAIFRCKICGGTLDIQQGQSVAVCEYCGSKQTLPRLDDERRANLYERANHFRRNNDFDKAITVYEQILNEDNTDAEAYWSLVLCRYGIEYVEDPTTHTRVPTVNRAQFTSVFDDEDYKAAIANADIHQRQIYEAEAAEINKIQKGILAISQKEEPFDVFICYKETDASGRRTHDSALATELYHELTREAGFKVFFSRITLESKLGVAYEPYIFAALHSAKVMVVLGTRPEHFEAVWVKNEWSRFLALIKQGKKKTLIPAYRDMDPYYLPEEFSHLQALDMSKLGFMQDLVHGIRKIVGDSTPAPAPAAPTVITVADPAAQPAAPLNIAALIKRAFILLESGSFPHADALCEQVLNQDPENANAYLGKLLAYLGIKKKSDLALCTVPFDNNEHFRMLMRFADDMLKAEINGYLRQIQKRNEDALLQEAYDKGLALKNAATNPRQYAQASEIFRSISKYKNAAELAKECERLAIQTRNDFIYNQACRLIAPAKSWSDPKNEIEALEKAANEFKNLNNWRDSATKAAFCTQRAKDLRVVCRQREITRRELQQREAMERQKRDKRAAIIFLSIIGAILLICISAAIISAVNQSLRYDEGVELMDLGNYEEALVIFEDLSGYEDSDSKAQECTYNVAVKLMDAEEYDKAISKFKSIRDYSDSDSKITECNNGKTYKEALSLMNNGSYKYAIVKFSSIDTYQDSKTKIKECQNAYFNKSKKALTTAKAGDTVKLGWYDNDTILSNGIQELEWIVLTVNGDKALLISKYILEAGQFSKQDWANSPIRTRLNGSFMTAAFPVEQSILVPDDGITDKVFLLTATQASTYMTQNTLMATKHPYSSSIYTSDWWLRSQTKSSYSTYIDYVTSSGSLSHTSSYYESKGVRPAIWVKIK